MPLPTVSCDIPLVLVPDPDSPGQVLPEQARALAALRYRMAQLELQCWALAVAHELQDFPEGVRLAVAIRENQMTSEWEPGWRIWMPGAPAGFNPDVVGKVGNAQRHPGFKELVAPHGIEDGMWNAMHGALTDIRHRHPLSFQALEQLSGLFGADLDDEPTQAWTAPDFRAIHERLLSDADLATLRQASMDTAVPQSDPPLASSAARPPRL